MLLIMGCGAVGGYKMVSSLSEPVSTCCCTFERPRMRSGGEVEGEQRDDNSSVLSAGAGASLAAP